MLVVLFAAFVAICLMLLALHLVQFIGLRIRNEAAPKRDPQLGRKFVLHLFQHFAILLVLSGFTISAIDVTDAVLLPMGNKNVGPGGFGGGGRGGIFFDEDDDDNVRFTTPQTVRVGQPGGFAPAPATPKPVKNWWNSAQRFATGLVLSGILQGSVVFTILLLGTNQPRFPAVGRVFGLARLLIAGIILMGCTTILIVTVLQKGSTDYNGLSMIIGILLIWGPTALGHLLWMRWTMNSTASAVRRNSAGRERHGDPDEDDEREERPWRRERDAAEGAEEPAPRTARRIPKPTAPPDEPPPRNNPIPGDPL